jgi:hypothetical protein
MGLVVLWSICRVLAHSTYTNWKKPKGNNKMSENQKPTKIFTSNWRFQHCSLLTLWGGATTTTTTKVLRTTHFEYNYAWTFFTSPPLPKTLWPHPRNLSTIYWIFLFVLHHPAIPLPHPFNFQTISELGLPKKCDFFLSDLWTLSVPNILGLFMGKKKGVSNRKMKAYLLHKSLD